METEIITTRSIQNPFQEIEVTKRCPRCQSVFITDTECESCHFQFHVEPVGEPGGFKSLDYIRSDFRAEFPFISFTYRALPFSFSSIFPDILDYRRKLNRRREVLCRYLFEGILGDRDTRRVFFSELVDICMELQETGMTTLDLLERIAGHERHPFYQNLSELLIHHENGLRESKRSWRRFLNYELFGILKVRFVLLSFILSSALIGFALYLFTEIVGLVR